MALKLQDVLVSVFLALQSDGEWTYPMLRDRLGLSVGELHNSISRLRESGLLGERVKLAALEEFLFHGVKYFFPPQRGSRIRGIPTAAAASPLKEQLTSSVDDVPVWPHPQGASFGYEFLPIYKTAPEAALHDRELYEILALLDAIRGGRARERRLATDLVKAKLQVLREVPVQ